MPPTYSETWDETKPGGGRDVSLGDDDIREFKRALRERLATDHEFESDESANSNIGYHTRVTLVDMSDSTKRGVLYLDNGNLYFDNADGDTIQITDDDEFADGTRSKQGDWQLSSVTTGRTGWTDKSTTYDDHFIRISPTPLSTAGSDTHTHGAGSYAHAHTHSIPHNGWGAEGAGSPGTLTVRMFNDAALYAQAANTSGAASSSAVTGSSASAENVPVYISAVLFQKD